MQYNLKIKIGVFAGYIYLFSFLFFIPYFIVIASDYHSTLDYFDALSVLGTDPETSIYYNSLLMLGGFLLFFYYLWYLKPSRTNYVQFSGWNWAINFGVIGGIGQFFDGLFANNSELHLLHMIAGIIFFGGIVLSILIFSLNFGYGATKGKLINFQANLGYLIVGFSTLYPLYVQFSKIKGIWQISLFTLILIWYSLENIIHNRVKSNPELLLIDRNKKNDIKQVYRKILIVTTIFGIFLIFIGSYMIIANNHNTNSCGTLLKPKQCGFADNILTSGSGFILMMGSLFLRQISKN